MADINVLSLFDGMSCGQIALERSGFHVNKYYASELDKYAIKVTQANYPNTIQLGDVTKWREWNIDWSSIDLLIGGSPYQGFSFAGKQLAFDDPRSKLFFVYVEIRNHINQARKKTGKPEVKFLLENVKMKKEYLAVITRVLGVEPVFINSALVSAQNRQRYYWANWGFEQPEDKGVQLIDILENEPFDKTIMSEKFTNRNKNAGCLRDDLTGKAKNLSAMEYVKNGRQGDYIRCGAMRGRYIIDGKRGDHLVGSQAGITEQRMEIRKDDKTNCLTSVQKDNYVVMSAKDKNPEFSGDYLHFDPNGKGNKSQCNRVNLPNSKHKSLSGTSGGNKHGVVLDSNEYTYRKLTPIECERLQTVPDQYTNHVSNTQRYKMLGNGWTVDVIAHTFKSLEVKAEEMRLVANG